MMVIGWIFFGILICINTAVYVGIGMAFDNNFWEDDVA
jgi:hypothetical protein